ncbi:hypothetical protein HanIR_Chr11g0505121 [Helianthus annuus]|nr:hypothetical protein HanIR_Chr11g0505121 [Helianthus annuus]
MVKSPKIQQKYYCMSVWFGYGRYNITDLLFSILKKQLINPLVRFFDSSSRLI